MRGRQKILRLLKLRFFPCAKNITFFSPKIKVTVHDQDSF